MSDPGVGITRELAQGKFTDEMLARMRGLIGTELRTDASINNEFATRTAILRFCEGIGDDNPLWTDRAYGSSTAYGGMIAPPSFIFACLASVQFGWPGLGGFHAETTLDFFDVLREGDRITARVWFDGFDDPIDSNFGGRRIKDYIRQEYTNQHGTLIARFICSRMRFERAEMQKRRESRKIDLPHPWTDAEIEQIESAILAEKERGAEPRYWDDVEVGDALDTLTKGPIGLTDEIAFVSAGAAPIPRLAAHKVALKQYRAHPKWAFRDPSTNALEPVYSVHYNDYAARLQGAQAAYDVGIQRSCWHLHLLTHWMGDDGFVKHAHSQYRSHVYLSDVVRLGGRVEAKEVDGDGDHVVKVATWAMNQRGVDVMPGSAVVKLPKRGSQAGGAT